MLKKMLGLGSIALAAAMPQLAHAQLTGVYTGAGLGRSDFKNGCPTAAGCNEQDTAFKFYSGFEFGRIFAAEFGFVNLGQITGAGGSFEAAGGELVGIARWPVTQRLGLFVKAGGYYLATNATPGAAGSGLGSASDENTDVTYGLGAKWQFAPNWASTLEWQRYKDVGEPGRTGQTDINYLGVSLNYHF